MDLQPCLPGANPNSLFERRFLCLFLPNWATDFLKRHDFALGAPLALYERIKGGFRLSAIDREAAGYGLKTGQNLADARALLPGLTVREMDRPLLEAAFADFADWHSNASPLVSVMTDIAPFGDLVLDITGVAHLFGGEAAMLRLLLGRLRAMNYAVSGAIAPTMGAAWAASHFGRSRIVTAEQMHAMLDAMPVAALRIDQQQNASLMQMGLCNIGQVRQRSRKALQARFGGHFLLRLDQAYGHVAERMTPRLPVVEHHAERRFAEPIILLDSVLMVTRDLAIQLGLHLAAQGMGAQSFHLFLYRVDHKVMTLSVNASRLTRDPDHIAGLFTHRAQRLAGEYDAGFGVDMIRLAAASVDALVATQTGAFSERNGAEDIEQLNDRMGSRLGHGAVLRMQLVASHIPERAMRLVPAVTGPGGSKGADDPPGLIRPLRLLPSPEPVAINAEVPDGLPASMIWRGRNYRLLRGMGPERLGAEWWRTGQRLQLVPPEKPGEPRPGEKAAPPPYIPNLPLFQPDAETRDYFVVEDGEGRRFWVFQKGAHAPGSPASWYLHGFFP